MRKRCKRVHSRGTAYNQMVSLFAYLQDSPKWTEWTVSRRISLRQAWLRVAAGDYEAIMRQVDGEVRLVGFRALKPTFSGGKSPATLTFGTMIAVGKEAQHVELSRHERNEIVKFRVWPLIGDTKAVAVRPRMTDAERVFAEKLLRGSMRMPKAA